MTVDEMIVILEMTTRYSYEYLYSLTWEQLMRLYEEKNNAQIQR
jgi:hypothetical protein